MLSEERLHILHEQSVILIWVSLKSRGLEQLVTSSTTIEELGIFLIVVGQAGDLTALPRHVT